MSEHIVTEHIVHVTDDSFEPEVLKSGVPVLVDYWAEWCGPCKAIAPILDEVAKEYDGKLKIAKLNVDDNVEVPKKYNIRGIPTLMLFKNGNMEAMKVGALSKSQLTAFLDSNILSPLFPSRASPPRTTGRPQPSQLPHVEQESRHRRDPVRRNPSRPWPRGRGRACIRCGR